MLLRKSWPLSSALAAALSLSGGAASAASVTDQFDVTITITDSCEITTPPNDLDFGSYGLLLSDKTGTTSIGVTCTSGLDYDIGLDAGANPSTGGDTNTRRMTNSGNFVSYDLKKPDGTTHWGNTISTDTLSSTGTGDAQSFTVNGLVPAQTTPPAATYTDTITVTVTY